MKKTLFTCALFASATIVAFAQGTVNFANGAATLITTNTPTGSGSIAGLSQYRVGLYVGAVGADPNSFVLVGLATNAPIAGRFNANPPGSSFALPSPAYPTSGQLGFQVRAWTLAAGLTEAEAMNSGLSGALVGRSSGDGVTTPGGGLVLAGLIFGDRVPDQFGNRTVGGFSLTPIPEPSSIAIGLLGLGAIALFRRRK